jgi:hypothetical protein
MWRGLHYWTQLQKTSKDFIMSSMVVTEEDAGTACQDAVFLGAEQNLSVTSFWAIIVLMIKLPIKIFHRDNFLYCLVLFYCQISNNGVMFLELVQNVIQNVSLISKPVKSPNLNLYTWSSNHSSTMDVRCI